MRLYTVLWTLVVLIANSQAWKIKDKKENSKSFVKFLNNSSHGDSAKDNENLSANIWDNSGNFVQDMVLGEEQKETLFNGFARIHPDGLQQLWRHNVVVYNIEANDFDYRIINDTMRAIKEIEKKTCLTFRKKEYYDKNYIQFLATKDDCFPNVRYAGGAQVIYFGNTCYTDDQPLRFILFILMLKDYKSMQTTPKATTKTWATLPTHRPYYETTTLDENWFEQESLRRTGMDDGDTTKLNLLYNCIGNKTTWKQYLCDSIYYWFNLCG